VERITQVKKFVL